MKKRALVLSGLLGFGVLFGCSQIENNVEAGEDGIFEYIGKSNTEKLSSVREVRHKVTGCHYLITNRDGDYARAMVQMLDKDGLPYCEGE